MTTTPPKKGRPRIGDATRVTLTTRVDRGTLAWLSANAGAKGVGVLVDRLVMQEQKRDARRARRAKTVTP